MSNTKIVSTNLGTAGRWSARLIATPERRHIVDHGTADGVATERLDWTLEIRWFVIPERPVRSEHLNEAQLAALVTPEAMMGVALVSSSHTA